MKNLLFTLLLLLTFTIAKTQEKIYPHITLSYIDHLGTNGINSEIGVGVNLWKRLDILPMYRFSNQQGDEAREVDIKSLTNFITYSIIKSKKSKLQVGPGFSYGNYRRTFEDGSEEKDYNSFDLHPLKIKYRYITTSNFGFGADASLYGDDGDGSTTIGATISYSIF